ncbi:MAG TPA: hypothetical protein ENO03_02645 [Candidatus Aminicenantes bacterium]|nr:hypothetical protein [Candidatus Aminicenantes bacterium]
MLKSIPTGAAAALLATAFLLSFACASPAPGTVDTERFWTPRDPPGAAYDLGVTIAVDGDQAALTGTGTISLTNTAERPISVLAFEWTVTPGRAFEAGVAGRPLKVLNADRGLPLTTPLLVALPEPLRPGRTVEIDVRFTHMAAVGEGQIHLGIWYPRLWWDGLSVRDSFKVKLEAPAGFVVAASGRLDPASCAYVSDSVTSRFGLFLSDAMRVERRRAAGVDLTALFTDEGRDCALFCLEAAAEIIAFYKDWLGFYPHGSLTILPGGPRPWGGYPYASGIVVVHGQETFEPSKPAKENWWWTWITAHEIGHQYWGESVMSGDVAGAYTESWLMIGLGICADKEYMLRNGHGWARHRGFIDRYLQGVRDGNDTTLDAPASLVKAQAYDRNNVLIHGKGFAVLSALETALGADAFDRLYRRAVREFAGRRLAWPEFQALAEAEAGESLAWFFEDWVRSNKILEARVASRSSAPAEGGFVSEARIAFGPNSIRMPIPLRAEFEDGTVQAATTGRSTRTDVLRFSSRAPLREVALDPERRLALVEEAVPRTAAEIEESVASLDWTGTGEEALAYLADPAIEAVRSPRVWFKLGLLLFDGGTYPESLAAFEKCRELSSAKGDLFGALVWIGHINDLLGDREAAVAAYARALENDPGWMLQHDQYNMRIGRDWLEQRLVSPFSWRR